MMGRREEADSNLRKDMFNSILTTFMAKDPSMRLSSEELIRQQILSLELLAYNFHESLDIGPLFKDVQRRIGDRGAGDERRTARPPRISRAAGDRAPAHGAVRRRHDRARRCPAGENQRPAGLHHVRHPAPSRIRTSSPARALRASACRCRPLTGRRTTGSSGSSFSVTTRRRAKCRCISTSRSR